MVAHFMSLEQQVEQFWKIDSTEILDGPKISANDRKVSQLWEETTEHRGRHYVMDIPFKERNLPYNKSMAEKKLKSLKKRLESDKNLQERYSDTMEDLIVKGYARKVQKEDIPGKWFLPHHPVINPHKPEKTRIVFDCAAKYRNISLNECVHQGPDLTNNLVGILMRFRQERVAIMGDIEAMFHQVKVSEKDTDVLRFLWWENRDMSKIPSEYMMTAHLFGGTWSPSCCSFALRKTAEDFGNDYDNNVTSTIKQNFYVDDCLKSTKTAEDSVKLISDLTEILHKGGFRLTKWISNSRDVLTSIPYDERAKGVKNLQLSNDALPMERALGINWNVEEDNFCFQINAMTKALTRRGLLSMVSSIYDPLGLAGPYIINAKKILQELTFKKVSWDEPLPEREQEDWLEWLKGLEQIEQFKAPRCIKPDGFGEIVKAELHHFSDASQKAYGAVSYLRLFNSEGRIHCSLVISKSHLAPLKQLTIPQLELQAATVSTRLDVSIRRELEFPIDESFFWTDSTIVLQYIKNEDKRFQTFVANRVAAIHNATLPKQWYHVDTKENPADYLSRGMTAREMLENSQWLNGPDFLWQNHTEPCPCHLLLPIPDSDPEVKATCNIVQIETNVEEVEPGPLDGTLMRLITYYSDWTKLKRAVAWILAVKRALLKKAKPPTYLSTEQLDEAEDEIVKLVQKKHYAKEIQQITKGSLPHDHPLRPLHPIVKDGLLCLGTRLKHSEMPMEFQYPRILPRKEGVVSLMIRHTHEITGHSGREYVISQLRKKYWIIGAREVTRKILRNCVTCKRYDSKPLTQIMAELPKDRVRPENPPFTNIGIDYFDPFFVKRGRGTEKRYGCLFTCMATRAIHVEIAFSLDTSSFINCLQRFAARRGMPESIRSDNGTNFVGGEREIRQATKEWNGTIEKRLSNLGVTWKFNPPGASHMGGIWERQIRSIRRILAKLTKDANFTDEGLNTLMCIIESIINNRPLTTVSSDPTDLEPLTPNHLLLLRTAESIPGNYDERECYTRRRWRHVQYLADAFWTRWLHEYLPILQLRAKWTKEERNLKIGDVVLIAEANTPRNTWNLGRVTNVFESPDGKVRSAELFTKGGTCLRPITKLFLLEGQETDLN